MFITTPQVQKIYGTVSTALGGIAEKVAPNTPGALSRTNKKNEEVFELIHSAVTGYIVGFRKVIAEKEKAQFGDRYELSIQSPELVNGKPLIVKLYFSVNSLPCRALLNTLIAMSVEDFANPIYLGTRTKNYEGKTYLFVNMYRGLEEDRNNKIEPFFAKEDFPEPKIVTLNGKKEKDFSPILDLLEKGIPGVQERIGQAREMNTNERDHRERPTATVAEDSVGPIEDCPVTDDDIPF